MKVELRKPTLKYGRNLLRRVHRGISRASLVGAAPFFPPPNFLGSIARWEEGKTMFFDDTCEHEVWNEIDGVRVVLFMDVLRPLSFPMSAIDRFVIKAIAASPFITDAKRNHEAWEQRMADTWR